jgi:release factor glutamine methyltransferase
MEVKDSLVFHTHPQLELNQSQYSISSAVSKDLREKFIAGVPFAYLTCHAEFYGRSFYIDERTLVPRQETELLVDHLVQGKTRFERALDIGTGSGAIILGLLYQRVAKSGAGCDISNDALSVARTNARRLRLFNSCEFLVSDLLEHVQGSFDLIVSNPPYIKARAHKKLVHQKVHEFEPALALYVEDERYEEWFKKLFKGVKEHLLPGGTFLMEGHELELNHQALILAETGFDQVKVLQDYAGLDRFLMAKKAL